MPTNIEIKAHVKYPDQIRDRVERLADGSGNVIIQEDTFFHTPRGRLKLRVLGPERGELIYYERRDATGPRQSDYIISPTSEPELLKSVLASSLGVRGVVRKQRLLYMVGNTRIHLDQVEGLGAFMELEVILSPGQSAEEGQAVASALMAKLGIKESDLIDVAYIDLLESRTAEPPEGSAA